MADIGTMLQNLSQSLQSVQKLITGAAYLIALSLFYRALYHMKIYGELRTMMASHTNLRQPLTYMLAGVVFMYLPTALEIFNQTAFGQANFLAYGSWVGAGTKYYTGTMLAIFRIIQVMGLISFIRGWMLIVKSVSQGAQPSFGKGITHIIAGVLGMNIIATANILSATLGVNFT